ncbi:MAG: pilin [Patescibacteria group bacterium]
MLFRRRRIIPFLLGFLPVLLAGYFVFVFVRPAAAQTAAGTQVSDQCHILSRCAGNGLACSNDGQCTDGTKCRLEGIQLNIHIPGVTEMIADANGVKHPYVRNMSCFLADIYRYLAGVSGILAVVMMIYGGIKYVISFGNPSKLSDARDTISSAMIGLALVLGSYVILNFINPSITSLKVPKLTDVVSNELGDFSDYHGTKICTRKAGQTFACGGIWHSGQDDQCTVVNNCNTESSLCTLFVGSDTKAYVTCMESLPVKYKDKMYDAHARNDESCGAIIFDSVLYLHDVVLVGTKCNDTQRACGIDIHDSIPHIYAAGEQRASGFEDQKYIGYYPKAYCY